MALDLRRPMTKRVHENSMQVIMYKDSPGVYYDATGHELKREFAEKAGFDVEQEAKRKEKMERINKAQREIEKDYETVPGEAVHKTGNLRVEKVDSDKDEYNIFEGDEELPLNDKPMGKGQAIDLADSLLQNGGSDA